MFVPADFWGKTKRSYHLELITHSQRETYMDLVEIGGGGRRQQMQEPHSVQKSVTC